MLTMIPYTDHACGNYTRVPPIYNSAETTTAQDVSTHSNVTHVVCGSSGRSRRGRRSNVPLEIREQTRRLKKQNMERRRRACISDKMNALHNLAMNLIGIDPNEYHKVEKADILNLCYNVFKGIANITKDEPDLFYVVILTELGARLRKLRNNLNEVSCPSSSSSSTSLVTKNNSTPHADEMDKSLLKVNEQSNSLDKRLHQTHYHHKNKQHSHFNTVDLFSTSTPSSETPLFCTDSSRRTSEDNKENRIPKIIIKNPLSTTNYTISSPVVTDVNSMRNVPLTFVVPQSLSSSSVFSTPPSRIHLSSFRHQQICEPITQWQSTPLQCTEKCTSLLNNSESGFFSSQTMELTPNITKMSTFNGKDTKVNVLELVDSSSIEVSHTASSSPSLSSPLPRDYVSAFSKPTKRLSKVNITRSSDAFVTSNGYQHHNKTTNSDSGIWLTPDTSASIETLHDVKPTHRTVPMWRPYLD
ncbi:unnamed protein product [Heterobilharzia americana]|nr:unnamed protein product [Heterobilharzia americana]